MELLLGKRQSGKTTLLIKRSIETGAHIVTTNITMAKQIYRDTEKLFPNKEIPVVYMLHINDSEGIHLDAVPRNGKIEPVRAPQQEDLLFDDYEVIVTKLLQYAVGYNNIIAAVASTNECIWDIKYIVDNDKVVVNTPIEKEKC